MSRYAVFAPGMSGETDDPEEARMWLEKNEPCARLYVDAERIASRLRAALYGNVVTDGDIVAYKLDRPGLDRVFDELNAVRRGFHDEAVRIIEEAVR